MELRHLRAFVAVANEGHFGRAATRLNLTQPGLTLRIQALEKELGTQLFERSARAVHLTAAGAALLPHARSLVRIEDRASRDLKDQAAGIAGRIRIAYLSYGPVTFPGKVMAEFRRRHPTMRVETSTATSDSNVERLLDGLADAAFLHQGFVSIPGGIPDGIAVRPLRRDSILLAMSANHRLTRLERVPVTALRGEPLIMPTLGTYGHFVQSLERWLAVHIGADPNVVAHEPPDQAFDAVAASTSLIAFANASRAESMPVPGIVYRRMSPDLLGDFGVAYFRDDESPTLANLLRLIDEMQDGEPGPLPKDAELLVLDTVPAAASADARRPPHD